MQDIIIGSHVSFNKNTQLLGSVKEALSYGANTFMFYTGAPQNTSRSVIDQNLTKEADLLMKKSGIDKLAVIIHAPYIINLANQNNEFAIDFLKAEIKRVESLGFNKLVLHPGSHVGQGRVIGINNIIDGLNKVINAETKVIVCLETMAGKGTELGINFEEVKTIIDGVNYKDKIGVCLDTCHLNDAGYDIGHFDKIIEDFSNIIGLEKLYCVHINDSKNELNAHKDRHENFGFGTIGFDNLIKVIYHSKLKGIPKILETPYITKDDTSKERLYPPYKFEIEAIRNKKINDHLIEDIRNYYSLS
ncbi:MAG: deoxyribonuclease IV [Bacilli bacterium]|nr:deoxyribonuclease IV [Bacilli bacterium]